MAPVTGTDSSGSVPSCNTLSTAAWPQACTMAGPGRRAGGEVMLPCADVVGAKVARTAVAARRRG